jgi:hypothetical protein
MTLRRRSKKMLGQIWSRPASAWRRITLPSLTRTFRTPKVLDQLISLPGYSGTLRQITITKLGHDLNPAHVGHWNRHFSSVKCAFGVLTRMPSILNLELEIDGNDVFATKHQDRL